MNKIKIGVNPLTWSNDDLPALGGETPLQQCLAEGKQAGFAGFELGQKFPRDPEVLSPVLQEQQLELVSGWFSGMILDHSVEHEIERLQAHLHLLRSLGCESVVYCDITGSIQGQQDTPLSQRPRLHAAQWQTFTDKLSQVADYVSSQGMKLAYHHHMGTIVESSADVDKLMELTSDSVHLLLDTGHMQYAGGDPVAMIRKYGHRICHVHCKDIRADIAQHTLNRDRSFIQGVLDGVFTIPGDGYIDFLPIFKELKTQGYAGWLVVEAEQDPVVAPSLETAKRAFKNMSNYATESGLLHS